MKLLANSSHSGKNEGPKHSCTSSLMNPEQLVDHAEDAERFLKHLGNKTRLMVLCSLLPGELSVSDLLTRVPVTQPVLSQHLALLREANMVCTRRDKQTIYYRLADQRIIQTMELLHSFFCAAEPNGD